MAREDFTLRLAAASGAAGATGSAEKAQRFTRAGRLLPVAPPWVAMTSLQTSRAASRRERVASPVAVTRRRLESTFLHPCPSSGQGLRSTSGLGVALA